MLHGIGSPRYSEHPDLGARVEGRQCVVPPSFQGRAHCHRLGVAGHDRHNARGIGASADLLDQRLRFREVAEHAVAQDSSEALGFHRLLRVLPIGLNERHPSLGLARQPLESLSRVVQHGGRRVKQRHAVAGLGQWERLMAGAAADIEHGRWWRGQMIQKMLVHHVGAHLALHRGIGLGEGVRQAGKGVIAHRRRLLVSSELVSGEPPVPFRLRKNEADPGTPPEWATTEMAGNLAGDVRCWSMDENVTTRQCWLAPPPEARAGWLVCRRVRATDADALHDAVAASQEHLRPWMPWAADYTPGMAREFVEHNALRPGNPAVSDASYVVCDRSGNLLGMCGLHARLGPNAVEIGYWVDVRHTRRKVATLAAAALTDLALGIPEVEFVEIHHDQANRASGAIPAKLGYQLMATVAGGAEAPGETGMALQWRMTRAAWPASAGATLLVRARATAP